MDNQQYGKLFSFIWNIANDVLVFAFEKGDYKKIILPFTVLRRIDVLLEETKAKVLEKKKFCDKNKLPYEQFLPPMTVLSFVIGVLPLLFASGAGANARHAVGITTFWGMLAAAVVGLLFVPLLYVLVRCRAGRCNR